MADLTITNTAVSLVKPIEMFTGPAGQDINAGQYVRYNPTTGKLELGNATTSAEARNGGVALSNVKAGYPLTVVKLGYLSLGAALDALSFDDRVFLSNTDGTLATTPGTIGKVVGTVVPGFGNTTPDKLLRVDLTGDGLRGIGSALIAGGVAGNHTAPGIAVGDDIVKVYHISTAASIATMADLTSEFTITAANTIQNDVEEGTDTTNDLLLVFWNDLT